MLCMRYEQGLSEHHTQITESSTSSYLTRHTVILLRSVSTEHYLLGFIIEQRKLLTTN